MALDPARKAFALARPGNIHPVTRLEDINPDLIARLQGIVPLDAELAERPSRGHARLLEMALQGFRKAALVCLAVSYLHGVITLLRLGLALDDHAGTRLEERHIDPATILSEDPGHPEFLSQ
jgi:hypothetical protein